MTILNVNLVPDDLLSPILQQFEGVAPAQASRATEIILSKKPLKESRDVTDCLLESGIDPALTNVMSGWLCAYDDPCPCWNRVNLNDIAAFDTIRLFSAISGISAKIADSLQAIRIAAPRPMEFREFADQLAEAGVKGPVIEALGLWTDAYIDDASNALNWAEFESALSELPLLEDVHPPAAAPGDTLRLSVRYLDDVMAPNIRVDGYPAEIVTYEPDESLIEIVVPDEACEMAEITLDAGGLLSDDTLALEVLPRVVAQDCPDSADTRLVVQGTTMPCLIDVTAPDPLVQHGVIEQTLETQFFCGTNSVILPRGGAASPVMPKYALTHVNDAMLFGVVGLPILASFVPIQFVGREEKDSTGKKIVVYYFFRDGKWWRVIDNEKMHPEVPDAVDVRPDIPDPNIREADATTAESLNKQFFPTGWQEMWEGFDEATARDLQIMFAMAWQMNGLGEEDLKVLLDIKRRRAAGQDWDTIFGIHWQYIAFVILIGLALKGAGPVLRRLFNRLFVGRLIKKITRQTETKDSIELVIEQKFRAGSNVKKVAGGLKGGVNGRIRGRVDPDAGELICDVDFGVKWVNKSGQKKLASNVFEEWIERLRKFAEKKGLKRVRIERVTTSPSGEKMLQDLGFERIGEKLNGNQLWRKVVDVN